MARYDCDNCKQPLGSTCFQGEGLYTPDYWYKNENCGGYGISYMMICKTCFETRSEWSTNLFINCERCGQEIEDGETFVFGQRWQYESLDQIIGLCEECIKHVNHKVKISICIVTKENIKKL